MGPKTKELIETLDQIIELLENDNSQHWVEILSRARAYLADSNFAGITLLLSVYGGMGSFNDLVIGQEDINGKFRWKPDADKNNSRLEHLRSKAYQLADGIKNECDC